MSLRLLAALLGIFLAAPVAARADYDPPALHKLFLESEVIVRGRIVELRAESYSFEVSDCLIGDLATGARIEVTRFQDWGCAQRMTPYRVGQNMLLFARAHEGRLRPIGAGDEGEFLLAGETLYCRYANLGENARPDERYGAYTYPYEPMRRLVVGYRRCFKQVTTAPGSPPRIQRLVGPAATREFSRKSTLHANLVSATLEAASRAGR